MADGDARLVVCCVGTKSEWGKVILELDEAEDEQTPLQEALEVLAKNILFLGGKFFLRLFFFIFSKFLRFTSNFFVFFFKISFFKIRLKN